MFSKGSIDKETYRQLCDEKQSQNVFNFTCYLKYTKSKIKSDMPFNICNVCHEHLKFTYEISEKKF